MGARDPRVGREGGVAAIGTRLFVALLLLALLAPLSARAQQGTFSQAELDQLLAPVALYPDPLLSQVLMASTYPLEVAMVDRGRWRHDPAHRRGVKYATPAVQNRYSHAAPRRHDGRKREDAQAEKPVDPRFQLLMRPPDPRTEHVLPAPATAQRPPTPPRPAPPRL